MRLHHIGIATKNIDKTADLFCSFGYTSDIVKLDKEQNVYVKFLKHSNAPFLELISGGNGSPVNKILERNGTCVYHLCYEVEDIDKSIQELRKQGYLPIGEKTKSVIDDRDIVFLFHSDNCLIELLDGGKSEKNEI